MSADEATVPAVEATEPAVVEPTTVAGEKPAEEKPADEKAADSTPKVEAKTGKDASGEVPASTKPSILKTKAVMDYKEYKKNVKYDPSVLPETDDPLEILTQIEFYFNNSNLPYDKHMWEITGGDKNKPVPVKDMCKFKRMQRFPYGAVIDALKGEHSRFLEVSGEPGQEVVKRKHAYVLGSMRAQQDANSIYAKGFGDEEPTTQFDLEAFFTQFFPINAVRLRRTNPQKMFKGSVFVEFQERESAEKFVALDPPPKWKDHDLLIMLKTTYMAGKSDAIRKGEIEPNRTRPNKFYEGRDLSGGGNRADKDDWKKRRENDQRNDNRRGGGGDRRGRGRGRGRGGRGRGGSDRDRDRNRNGGDERREHNPNGVKPRINTSPKEDAPSKAADVPATDAKGESSNSKRSREENAPAGEPAAKKQDTGGEVAA